MIVPVHWAEARAQRREASRQVTVRRFGWSDESHAEAQAHAETRAADALERIWSGDKNVLRREPKIAYNGAHGVPIREEIIARQGDAVVTRNGYGAHCLNTPGVLFADIDFASKPPERMGVRNAWIEQYEARAGGYAACRFIESIGSGTIDANVRPVLEWHDAMSGARTQKPLA